VGVAFFLSRRRFLGKQTAGTGTGMMAESGKRVRTGTAFIQDMHHLINI
jgi:hypothetical protein